MDLHNRRYRKSVPSLLVFISLTFFNVVAQTTTGRVAGVAQDKAGGILPGGRVELQPIGRTAVTNPQGAYTVLDVPGGTYKLTVSYLGFAPFESSVTVTPGTTTQLNAVLEVASKAEEINVVSYRQRGQAEAVNEQENAPNILEVLPAEVIRSLPNANIADAIGRLPGVTLERDEGEGKYVQIRGTQLSFSNVTINGTNVTSPEAVRQVKLDIIPSDLVEAVQINKTLEANMDGDAIGGSVNLVTKTATEKPTVSLFGIGGYTPIFNGRGEDEFGGTIGYRFGRSKKLGVLIGGAYDWNGRGINDVEPALTTVACDPGNCLTPGPNAANYATVNTEDLRDYRYYRARWGFEGSADYKFSDTASLYVRGLYSHFNNFGDRWVYTPSINSFTTSALQGNTNGSDPTINTGTGGTMSFNASIRRPVQVIGSLQAGGHIDISNSMQFVWDASASRASTEDLGYSQANFGGVDGATISPLNNVEFGLNRSNPYRPSFTVQNGANIYDPTLYYLQGIDFSRSYSPQVNLQAGASLSKAYSWGGHTGILAFGGKFRNEHKFEDANDVFYNPTDPMEAPLSNFLSGLTDHSYYDRTYTEGPFADYNKIRQYFAGNPAAFSVDALTTQSRNLPNNWNLLERISAGYLMNTLELGRFRLYAGIRFEATNLNILGYNVVIPANGTDVTATPLTKTASYVDSLPSAELKYRIDNDSDIRLAYGRGIARPDFQDLPPYVALDDRKQSISVGNPNLTAVHANNYDVLYERYLKSVGLITGGFFYKDITSPIYYVQSTVASGTYAGYQQTTPSNGSSAYVYGFETAYQQHLSFLPGPLGGLGISANYSWTTSLARGVPGRSDQPSLLRQAPNTWNVSPTYDRGRFSLRVGLAYNGANIFQYNYQDGAPLGLKGPLGDLYLYSHFQVDAQGSYRLSHGFTAIVRGLNLNNEVFGFYQGSPQYPIQREYYKPTISAGVRWDLHAAE